MIVQARTLPAADRSTGEAWQIILSTTVLTYMLIQGEPVNLSLAHPTQLIVTFVRLMEPLSYQDIHKNDIPWNLSNPLGEGKLYSILFCVYISYVM